MQCIGGISILFVIHGMLWNLNPTCNIFRLRYYIYSIYICFSSVTGVNIKQMRTDSCLSITGTGCGLTSVGVGEEQARKVIAGMASRCGEDK
jgi:hypothetical protein